MTATSAQVSIADVKNAHQRLSGADSCIDRGDLDGARQICEKLLENYPDYSSALSVLAVIHMQQANYAAAFPLLVKASILSPNDPAIFANLGKVYLELGAGECALQSLERANMLNPSRLITYYFMGEVMLQRQDYVRAEESFKKLLVEEPDNSSGKIRLGICQARIGCFDDALSTLKSALEMPLTREEKALLLYMLSELPALPEDIDILAAVNELGDPQPDDTEITGHLLGFTRGITLDKKGDYHEAWRRLIEANRKIAEATASERQTYFKQGHALLDKAIDWQPARNDASASNGSDIAVSLFILGPSRSGKTSLENLMASVAGVRTGFEHNIVKDTVKRTAQMSGLLTEELLANLPAGLNDLFADKYHSALSHHGGGARLLTITHPGAISDVGRLADCVPGARFIFMKRDLDDNALRIFTYFYNPNTNLFANNIKDIYEYLDMHNRLIDNWLEKLGTKAMLVSYEELAENPEAILSRVCEFCRLEPPSNPNLRTGDDRGCAKPYRTWLHDAQRRNA